MPAPSINGEPKISQKGPAIICECIVDSSDEPKVKWSKDEKDLEKPEDYKFKVAKHNGGKFKVTCEITCFEKSHAGIYNAAMTNSAGTTNATFTVTAGDAPEFTDKPHIVSKNEGKILGIKIRAKSKHEATAAWMKNDEEIKFNDRVKNVVKTDEKKPGEYVFQLEITEPEKSDEGKYICTVKNKEGQNSQSLNLNFD